MQQLIGHLPIKPYAITSNAEKGKVMYHEFIALYKIFIRKIICNHNEKTRINSKTSDRNRIRRGVGAKNQNQPR